MKYYVIILVVSMSMTSAYAYSPNVQILAPVTVFGKNYHLEINGSGYDIYYGFRWTNNVIEKINFLPERNTMHIDLSRSNETDAIWIHIPQEVISADKNNFVVYVDGQEKKYELAESDHSIVLSFLIPANSTSIDIQGTRVIPEFPTAIVVAVISFVIVIYSTRFIK